MKRGLKTTGLLSGVFIVLLTASARAERELTSDRPDTTESAYTIEPGRVQVEGSFVEYTRDQENPEHSDVRVTAWSVAPTNVRVGLTKNFEVQFVVDTYLDVEVEDRDAGVTERTKGFGDVTLRAKRNLWGNDGGDTALAMMPFVKLPTAKNGLGNDSVEGGLIFPFAAELRDGWGLGAMTELDVIRNEEDDGYAATWLNTFTVGRDITEKLGGFVELAAEVGEGKPAFSFNGGLTYAIDANLQLDLGLNVGLSRPADDLRLFTGFVKRF